MQNNEFIKRKEHRLERIPEDKIDLVIAKRMKIQKNNFTNTKSPEY